MIAGLCMENDEWCTYQAALRHMDVRYFQNLFSTDAACIEVYARRVHFQRLASTVWEDLDREVSDEEVRHAIFRMNLSFRAVVCGMSQLFKLVCDCSRNVFGEWELMCLRTLLVEDKAGKAYGGRRRRKDGGS
ncbi:hypothetical protein V6N12_023426 [Hibiscus sabdariffa]|uniref:Uncharacterized protein n=1 Tax=Hibiscus sabdariffa TaxID=183260 RepID=A0ABR2FY37_9ROSI